MSSSCGNFNCPSCGSEELDTGRDNWVVCHNCCFPVKTVLAVKMLKLLASKVSAIYVADVSERVEIHPAEKANEMVEFVSDQDSRGQAWVTWMSPEVIGFHTLIGAVYFDLVQDRTMEELKAYLARDTGPS